MTLVAESLPVDPAKTRKRPAVKASPRPPAEKQKLTLYVSTESAQRLAVGPELAERVAEAVADARAGRRPRW